jgi:hypothetical protein
LDLINLCGPLLKGNFILLNVAQQFIQETNSVFSSNEKLNSARIADKIWFTVFISALVELCSAQKAR